MSTETKKKKKSEEAANATEGLLIKTKSVTQIVPSAIYGFNEAVNGESDAVVESHPDYPNPRDEVSETVVERVKESKYIFVPVTLYTDPGTGDIVVVDGRNRLTAIAQLTQTDPTLTEEPVPCQFVSDEYTPDEVRAWMIRLNSDQERSNLNQLEEAKAVLKLVDTGKSVDDALKLFERKGQSGKRWLTDMQAIVGSKPLTEAVQKGKIDTTTAAAIGKNIEDEEDQKRAIDKFNDEKKRLTKEGVPEAHVDSKARVAADITRSKKLTSLNVEGLSDAITKSYLDIIRYEAKITAPAVKSDAPKFDEEKGRDPGLFNALIDGVFLHKETLSENDDKLYAGAYAIDLDEATTDEVATFIDSRMISGYKNGILIGIARCMRCRFAEGADVDPVAVLEWVRDNVIDSKKRKDAKFWATEVGYWGEAIMEGLRPKLTPEEKRKKKEKEKADERARKEKEKADERARKEKERNAAKNKGKKPAKPAKPAKKKNSNDEEID